MGEILHAICGNCNFSEKFFYGGGMMDHLTNCSVPAIDKVTGQLVQKNYFEKDTFNGQFVFYNEPEMYEGIIQCNKIQWDEIQLKPTENFCPNCKQFTMKFESAGCCD